jgi:hypothetical protein
LPDEAGGGGEREQHVGPSFTSMTVDQKLISYLSASQRNIPIGVRSGGPTPRQK